MKLTVPPIEISEDEGFSSEKDIFQRKPFAEQLTNLINNVDDELVIALDAPWGEGKTTFVKMWQGLLKGKGIKNIYFDAFKNDFLDDPLLALIGEVYELLDEGDDKEKFKQQAVSALKIIGKASVRIALRAVTAGVLDDTVLEGAGAGDEAAGIADKYISDRLDSLEKDKESIEAFRTLLEATAKKLGGDKKIIFIVDELDRCKPSFALDLLEKIKHLFSVPGITFVLVMNKEQISNVIESRYGQGIESHKYLQKFIHIWAELPKSKDRRTSTGKVYLDHCLSRMGFEIKVPGQPEGIAFYKELIDYYGMSLRDIERSLTNFAIIHNIRGDDLAWEYRELSIFLSISKVLFPACYKKMRDGNTTYEKVIHEAKLGSLEDEWWKKQNEPESHSLKWTLRYSLSSEEELQKIAKAALDDGRKLEFPRWRNGIIDICGWLESFPTE